MPCECACTLLLHVISILHASPTYLRCLCFELTTIIALEYLRIGERTNLVNVGNHISYLFHMFRSQRSSDFVSESDINFGENVFVLIPVQHIAGHVQQVELMYLTGNCHVIMRYVEMLWRW